MNHLIFDMIFHSQKFEITNFTGDDDIQFNCYISNDRVVIIAETPFELRYNNKETLGFDTSQNYPVAKSESATWVIKR